MKKRVIALWGLFVICLIVTVFLNHSMASSDVEYEEVEVTVLSAKSIENYNRKTGTRVTTYKIEVQYQGKKYQLENAHNSYMYREGAKVKAYLSKGRLFADIDGVKTSTPLAAVYFV